MHELSIAESVVGMASRQANGRRVTKVQMRVGHLRQVVPSALAFGFELLAERTSVEGAELEVEQVPVEARCRGSKALKEAARSGLRFMRDPTRGGVGTVLNELARDSGLGVVLWEERLPVRDVVHGACEILGIDPLYVANEGKLLAVVASESADAALEVLRDTEGGGEAQIIGEVREEPECMVAMHTQFGDTRMIDMLVGDPLPRIC